MLLAASESAVTKNPRLRLTISRSSSVSPFGFFHSSISRCMLTSCGIQWFAHPARYLSHAHLYLNGTSWLTSAWPLITRLSSTRTRLKPFCIACCSASRSCTGSRASRVDSSPPVAVGRAPAGAGGALSGEGKSSSKLSMGCLRNSFLYWGKSWVFTWKNHPRPACWAGAEAADFHRVLVHGLELVVEEFRREILAVELGDLRESVVEVERREAVTIAERLEILAVQLVGQVHHSLASIVEFQPDLVIAEVTRVDNVPWRKLVPSQQVPPFAKWTFRACRGFRRQTLATTSAEAPHWDPILEKNRRAAA